MRLTLAHRPSVVVVLLDSANKPIQFTYKRLEALQDLQAAIPDFPVKVQNADNVQLIPIQMLELYAQDIKVRNTSCA